MPNVTETRCMCPVDSDALGYQHTWGWKKRDCPIHGARERIVEAGDLMQPGGGSLETTTAVQALHLICLAQQDEIDSLRARLDAR